MSELPCLVCLRVFRRSPERPLHHSERVLEQVLEWSGLDCPSSAFLVIKRFPEARAGANGKGAVCKWWQNHTQSISEVGLKAPPYLLSWPRASVRVSRVHPVVLQLFLRLAAKKTHFSKIFFYLFFHPGTQWSSLTSLIITQALQSS